MKKLLLTLLVLPSVVFAQHYHHHGHYVQRNDWVAPLIIGGVIGYSISQRPVNPPQTVIINGQPNYSYTDTYELVYIDGVAYRKHKLYQNGMWQDVFIRF